MAKPPPRRHPGQTTSLGTLTCPYCHKELPMHTRAQSVRVKAHLAQHRAEGK